MSRREFRVAERARSQEEALQRLLEVRAERLAQVAQEARPGKRLDFVIFELEGESYAIPATAVRSVSPSVTWVCVPGANAAVVGVAGRRGRLVAVADLASLLRAEQEPRGRDFFLWIFYRGVDLALGADAVRGLESVAEADIAARREQGPLCSGLLADGTTVIDLDAALQGLGVTLAG